MSLPGDLPHHQKIARMVRVNHAGEYGAQRIYAGQLAVLGKSASAPLLRHMAQQEQAHLECFSTMIKDRHVRPTALMPLWHVGGWVLGAATALLGEKAAMACTVGVESVIDAHYAQQQTELAGKNEPALRDAVDRFRAEEQEHYNEALHAGAKESPFFEIIEIGSATVSKMAIWLSTRL